MVDDARGAEHADPVLADVTSGRVPGVARGRVLLHVQSGNWHVRGAVGVAGHESFTPDAVASGAVDLEVEHEHEHERAVEGAHGGEDGVAVVLADHAHAAQLRVVGLVSPAEKRRDGDGHRHQPHDGDHHQDLSGAAAADVVDVGDGPEAVHGDGDQVEDGGRAAQQVHGHPHVAQRPPQVPVDRHLQPHPAHCT